jgi:endonuclease-3 related protein
MTEHWTKAPFQQTVLLGLSWFSLGMIDKNIRKQLTIIYRLLFRAYGPQHWWPGDTPFEVMVGAVLTQNTSWANVEKAIANLKREGVLTFSSMIKTTPKKLALLIRPSGYFNIKTNRLRNLLTYIHSHYSDNLVRMFATDPAQLRRQLLEVNGIGPETADSILLYAGGMPFFVVDAYTRRIFSRQGLIAGDAEYHTVQGLFMDNLPGDTMFYNEYHALIVRIGKEHCRKIKPLCYDCPIRSRCRQSYSGFEH